MIPLIRNVRVERCILSIGNEGDGYIASAVRMQRADRKRSCSSVSKQAAPTGDQVFKHREPLGGISHSNPNSANSKSSKYVIKLYPLFI